jgi:hypothetical protein
LNLEILLGQSHSTDAAFRGFAQDVFNVQEGIYNFNGSLTAWTEGVYPAPTSYVYENVELDNAGTCEPWTLSVSQPINPVLAFTKTAFSYLAIYPESAYTDALVTKVSALASPSCSESSGCGFGEAVNRDGTSAESFWPESGATANGFYSDKTQEQVIEAAYYAITHSPSLQFGPGISSVVSAGAGSVWFVLPDFTAGLGGSMHTSAAKCGGYGAALATDVYAATYLFGALANPQNEILDTNSAYVSQSGSSCGEPTTPTSQPLVTVAGTAPNEVVGYYWNVQQTSPITYSNGCFVSRATGADLDCSTATATNDVFIMEVFTDSAGRTVYTILGRSWGGTLAGFEYVVNFVLKNPSSYTSAWYVYRWQDAASGVSANAIPDPGDTYTQLAAGS